MNRFAFLRSRRGLVAVALVVVLGGAAVAWAALGGDDDPAQQAGSTRTSQAPTEEPAESESTEPEPSAAPSDDPTCEGPDTQFNLEGVEQPSLLPDCGQPSVTVPEQRKAGLGLGCGGLHPIILYKTRTADTKSSICGVNSSGEELRVVVAPGGGPVLDLKGRYEYKLDAFVGKDGDTTYIVQAYDGTILTQRDGQTSSQKSVEWSSLDNEPDGEADYN